MKAKHVTGEVTEKEEDEEGIENQWDLDGNFARVNLVMEQEKRFVRKFVGLKKRGGKR